jgi:ceramide glucosyltransferase
VGAGILGDRKVLRDFWLIPLRDLFGFAVWAAGIFGDTVQWRDRQLKLRPDGRIFDDEVHRDGAHPIDDGAASR